MTNGEKLREVFPNIKMWGKSKDTLDYSLGGMVHRVMKNWWNAGYKEPSNSGKPNRWIPVSERLPEIKQHVLLSCYGRVIYGRMISEDGNSGYPVFEICDSVGDKRPVVLETTVHSEYTASRIKAWMPLPAPYKAESEEL